MIEHDIWFSMLKISENTKINLLKKFKTTENIWHYCNDSSFIFFDGYNEQNLKEKMKEMYIPGEIDEIKEKIYKNEIKIVNYNDCLFPLKLKHFDNSPAILFYKGNLEKLNTHKSAAIVGSRNCSSYGISAGASIVKDLCKYEFNIISGLARGIDSIAHKTAIASNAFTCGVLGCGIDITYPKENIEIYKQMSKTGCIVSEFIPGTKPMPYNFPKRNRIISALSDNVIVVEADEKSGSLITAGWALEQGKTVFAVPGSIFSKTSRGTNKLIRDGAYIYTDIVYLLEVMQLDFNLLDNEKVKHLNKIQESVYTLLSDNPMHIDEIINLSHIDIKQLYEVLFELQLENRILCLPGNYYIKTTSE